MSAQNTGGPAFPIPVISQNQSTGETSIWQTEGGMTLRDYFATHASDEDVKSQVEVIRAKSEFGILPDGWKVVARYMHADAMLKAREA